MKHPRAFSDIRRTGSLRVCIASPYHSEYSETFIHAHIERLPAKVWSLHGEGFPAYSRTGENIFPIPERVLRVILRLTHRKGDVDSFTYSFAHFLRKHRIDVVLAEYGPTAARVMTACQRSGTPLVAHFHGFDAYDQPTLFENSNAYRRLFSSAAALVVVSKDMREQLHSLGAPGDKLELVPYGVDTDNFGAAKPAGVPPHFLAVGRFVDKKGPHLTLLAFSEVKKSLPEARLTMVGDGPLLESSKQLAHAIGIAQEVTFTGPLGHSQVADLMTTVRAFVQHSLTPTYGDSEGTPVAILEAAASGLPIVSTRHTGIAEIVQDESSGFLVEEGDIASMAERMRTLAVDPGLAESMGKMGRAFVVSNHDMDTSIQKLLGILQRAAGS